MLDISSTASHAVNPTYAYIGAFVDELQRVGIAHIVICPGSRSTPLAMVCANQPAIRCWMHVDERSAAFFALGMAKQLRQPVALLCTSGTAAANFLPAIVEARLTHVPLLVLTADRPHELRECGAPQAIDQNRLYGTHVKWFADVALPEATNAALRYIRTLACRAASLTQAVPAGPVHLNFPLREPLTPEPGVGALLPAPAQRDAYAWQGRPYNAPYISVSNAPLATPSPTDMTYLMDILSTVQRGLMLAGPNTNPELVQPLIQLAHQLHYPILADPLSQLRCGKHSQELVISSYDAFLRIEQFVASMSPEVILRFGAMPTSKPLLLYLQRHAQCPIIVIDEHNDWNEPTQLASHMFHTDPVALCQQLSTTLSAHHTQAKRDRSIVVTPLAGVMPSTPAIPSTLTTTTTPATTSVQSASTEQWTTTWQQADHITRHTLQSTIEDFTSPFEGRVFSELARLLPEHATLYTGNSMPIRDLDTFFWGTTHPISLLGNRGANGIDGIVSSALGVSAVSQNKGPTVLVLGDLSFFHDLNGLLAARLHQLDLTIILINNDGGGIFSFLPQAAYPEHFEQLFGTPTGLDFRLAVQMYGGQFQRVEHWKQFREEVSRAMRTGGLHVIEVATERESNVRMHRQLWQAVHKALAEQGILAGDK